MQALPSGLRIVELMVLIAPAYLANMAPPFLRFWHGPNPAISRAWLGEHKTVGGFVVGTLAGVLAAFFLSKASLPILPNLANQPIVKHWFWFGSSLGFFALLGDSIKSFIKRRLNIRPGAPWVPFDQLDFVVAAILVVSCWVEISWIEAVIVLAISFLGDLIVNQLSYRLGIKRTPW
jgi:CDP-2,3-bis-(O-geranylgeranyl)-sn-glycerol synthase